MPARIAIDPEKIAAFCRKHRIRKLSLFGSVLRDDFHAGSDVDVLVEFEPDVRIGWDIVDIEDELTNLLGRKVDLRTPDELSRYIRRRVMDGAEPLYVQG